MCGAGGACVQGEGVVILRKVDQNWYEGCVPGGQRRGIFPVSYVSAPYGQPRWQTPVADSEQVHSMPCSQDRPSGLVCAVHVLEWVGC